MNISLKHRESAKRREAFRFARTILDYSSSNKAIDGNSWGSPKAFTKVTTENNLEGFFYTLMKDKSLLHLLACEDLNALEKGYLEQKKTNLLSLGHLHQAFTAFKKQGVKPIPLKGASLTQRIYPDPGMRHMNDLDVLIRKEDLSTTTEILKSSGWSEIKGHEQNSIHRIFHKEILKEMVALELHFTLSKHRYISFDINEIWQRSKKGNFMGTDAYYMDPVDELCYLTYHAANHVFSRPQFIIDIHYYLDKMRDKIDPETLYKRAQKYHCLTALLSAISIANELFSKQAIPAPLSSRSIATGKSLITKKILTANLFNLKSSSRKRYMFLKVILQDNMAKALVSTLLK